MIVRTLWITRKYDTGMPPELLEAWDEVSIDENSKGFFEACNKALESIGSDLAEFRYLDLEVPELNIRQAFQPPVIESQVKISLLSYRDGVGGATK